MSDQPPRLYSLKEAAQLLSPDGRLTSRSLRTMARRGQLQLVRVAARDYVTAEALNAMVTAATLPTTRPPCPDDANLPGSISAEAVMTEDQLGSFSTDRVRLAQAQAHEIVQRLKKPSKLT
jgi:hypothetical protein